MDASEKSVAQVLGLLVTTLASMIMGMGLGWVWSDSRSYCETCRHVTHMDVCRSKVVTLKDGTYAIETGKCACAWDRK